MRRLLPLLLAIAVATPGLRAEEPALPDLPQGITATIAKTSSNVRYGPNTNSRIACTLSIGDQVEVLGKAEVADWYMVRLPQKAQAWVFGKNLMPLDSGKRWKVIKSGTNARDDATQKGTIVAELQEGEVLDDRNAARGDWHAVYVPSAVAYVHKSLLSFPDAEAIKRQQEQGEKAKALWDSARVEYERVRQQLSANPDAAADLDLTALQQELGDVAKSHGDAQVRLTAARCRDGIAVVADRGRTLRETRGGKTTASPPVASGTGSPTAPVSPVHKLDTSEPPLQTPDNGTQQPTEPAKPALPAPQAPAAQLSFIATGFVSENSDYPKVGAPNLLLDGNSNVVAFLAPKAGSTVNLSEYYWRWVGVAGESKELDPTLHGLGKKIPLIEVEAVQLVKK